MIITSDIIVKLRTVSGSDRGICESAWVSSGVDEVEPSEKRQRGLIRALVRDKHGSPTEEGFLSFYIEAPRAVRDEHVRHRIGSYSSSSLRYKMETPVFYLPPPHRPLKKAEGFKQIQPVYEPYSEEEYERYRNILIESYRETVETLALLEHQGFTETEARRWVTTDSLITPYIARFNPRSLLNFLSLRTHDPQANHPSFPMWEIEQVARQMEQHLSEHFPLLHAAWNEFGREAI